MTTSTGYVITLQHYLKVLFLQQEIKDNCNIGRVQFFGCHGPKVHSSLQLNTNSGVIQNQTNNNIQASGFPQVTRFTIIHTLLNIVLRHKNTWIIKVSCAVYDNLLPFSLKQGIKKTNCLQGLQRFQSHYGYQPQHSNQRRAGRKVE